ncbi:MAG: cache domain-containing protein [Desulfuromonadaceae bacterium]|nr:cache domain-containing protein [Desulfuromonadaceae bacterium]MDD2856357.1 cache domain-containing protein [Desulfuromonadaceae bacterium]
MKLKPFRNWKIFNKIISISVVSIILLYVVSIISLLPYIENMEIEDKNQELRNINSIVLQLVSEYNERAEKGEFTLEEAQRRVKNRIRGLRYENNEYFFIFNKNIVVEMHPFMPELEGKSGAEIKDPTGKALFAEMAKISRERGEGTVSYMWPKPGQSAPSPKISYFKIYEPWGWIVGTGTYIDDIYKEINLIRYGIMTTLLISSILIMIMSLIVARKICQPLFEAIETSKRLAHGDLSGTIEVRSSDETGQLMQAMRQMIVGLRNYQSTQDLLHESQERLALIIQSTDDGIISIDLDGNVVTWNRGAEEIFGYTGEEMIGKSSRILIPDSLESDEQLMMAQCISGGNVKHFEAIRQTKDGRRIDVSITISGIRDDRQEIIGVSKIVRDITAKKRVEGEKTQFYGRFKSIMDSLDSLVYVVDIVTHEVLFINKCGTELFGDIEGSICWQTIQYGQSEPCSFCTNDRLILDNGEPAEVTVWEFQNTVTGRWYQCRDKAIRWHDNRLVRLEYATDITDRKKAEEEKYLLEEQLQQTQKLESLGVLAGGIAHDFNNILQIIKGYSFLIMDDPERAELCASEIEKAVERAAQLCRQMLAYAGKAPFQKVNVNLWLLALDMTKMLKTTLPQNVDIKLEGTAEIPLIEGDAGQLSQVIMNLITNASEAIGEIQGEVKISIGTTTFSEGQLFNYSQGKADPSVEYVCLEVADNGSGMDEETKKRIFEPFYTTKFYGRGLGMSVVLGIIQAHKGVLQLFSEPGMGSCFKVCFPVIRSHPDRDATLLPASKSCRVGATVLLVEDEQQVRNVARMMLDKLGYNVIEASNGREGVDIFQLNAEEIGVVLTDLGMPVMDGYEMFRELKKIRPDLPIILSSGFGDAEVASRINIDKTDGLISKPYNYEQLRDVLKKVTDEVCS